MWTKPSPPIARAILEIIQERLIVRECVCAWVRARVRSVHARCVIIFCRSCQMPGPALATGYFWFHIPTRCIFGARRARLLYFVLARGKKKGWEKGGEVEFVTGDALRKQRATDTQKVESAFYGVCYNTTKSAVSMSRVVTCRTIISSYPRYVD